MKRRRRTLLMMIVLLLVGGAVVNVAVAWGCALWIQPTPNTRILTTGTSSVVPKLHFSFWTERGATRVLSWPSNDLANSELPQDWVVYLDRTLRPYWSRISHRTPADVASVLIEDARGWPFLSMMSVFSRSTQFDTRGTPTELLVGIQLPPGPSGLLTGDTARAIPTRPIWPGFAINTVFYAVVLWLLFAAPFVVRRWRRIRRGLCPKCAYDLRGSVVGSQACPECGDLP